MELNIAVTNLVPLIGLLEEREASVQPGSVGVVIEAADPGVVIVDFEGVLVSAAVTTLLPLVRRGLPIRKYRLQDLLMQIQTWERTGILSGQAEWTVGLAYEWPKKTVGRNLNGCLRESELIHANG